ncbi:MAG: histidine phosphatase family protein [Clostridiales bacterium]|nr:histidine phosphatase family protein [Clostridiales bacterium]
MQLVFIRHGDPDYDIDGLTDIGKMQAKALAEYLKNEKFDAVYASPLGRALLTAKVCFDDKDITVLDWLREFAHDVTLLNGAKQLSWDFMPSYFCGRGEFYDYNKYLDCAEMKSGDIKKFYAEVIRGFDGILAENGYVRENRYYRAENSNKKRIVFFCHFGVMSVIMSHIMNVPHVVIAQHFCASPSSITTFATEERENGIAQLRCLSYGATPHLDVKNIKPSFAARFCETFDSDERH